jgi:hypothetical protein
MAAFRFSLQPLLDRLAHIEAAKRQALLAAELAAAREAAKLASLAERLGALSHAFSDDFRSLAASDVRGLLLEIDVARTAVAQQELVVKAADAAAAGVREEFLSSPRGPNANSSKPCATARTRRS